MKTRTITLPTGSRMRVPENIVRLDGPRLAGWQVRYCGTRYFSDGQGSTRASLRLAMAELELRWPPSTPPHRRPMPPRWKSQPESWSMQ